MDNSTNFQDETKSSKQRPPSSHRLPQVRKSSLNMEKLILKSKTIKHLSFKTENEIRENSDNDSLKNLIIEKKDTNESVKYLIIENNNSDYKNQTIETRSFYSTSKIGEESSERPKNHLKRNVLQNLLYLYDQEINKMKK